jgi:hypothetical protein
MSNFPASLHTKLTLLDNTDDVLAAHPNTLSDELYEAQVKLGIDSSSVVTTIDYFLKHASGAYRTHKHDGSSDDGSTTIGPLTAFTIANNIDVGDYQIRAKTLYADVPIGTAPLTITSTTVVSNLNADTVDALHSTDIVQMTGNQTVAGIKTFSSSPVVPTPTTDMQTSTKKYVDDTADSHIAAIGSLFGAWASKNDNTVYQAATDGFVCAYSDSSGAAIGLTDSSNPPTTRRQGCNYGGWEKTGTMMMPVRKGNYWKTYNSDNKVQTVWWIPLGI